MSDIGVYVYFCIIGLSHVGFGIFSTKHRYNKIITYIGYAMFYAVFVGIGLIKMKFYVYFLAMFSLFLLVYLLLSGGKVMKNLVLLISYLTYMIIYFGITFATTFIDGPAKFWIRWLIILSIFAIMESFLYLYLIPQFKKASEAISKDWSILLIGDILFLVIIFMQIFWPFNLLKDNIWTIILFLLSSFIYLYLFIVVFKSYATQDSYNKEREKNTHLQVVANHDSLTSLFNRNYFEYYGGKLEKKAKEQSNINTAVIVMDINKFKVINDTYGHAKGDETLKEVAAEIKNVFFEEIYTPFRVGGDEFVILAEHTEVETIKAKIKELKDNLIKNNKVSIAIGYSFVDYSNFDAIMTAFKNADKFMYQNKIDN